MPARGTTWQGPVSQTAAERDNRRVTRCRPRAINADQEHLIWVGLTGGYSVNPTRNVLVGITDECDDLEQMRRMGLLRLDDEIPGMRKYKVTEAGAAAIGMSLPPHYKASS
jgi:hypothetical protein